MVQTVFYVFTKKIKYLNNDGEAHLAAGAAKDYAEYKEVCGMIRGLNAALRDIEDLSRNYMEDEDD